ncbi:MAG TPA: zinc ribbon domain-containing protein [Herbaspirillum sp.]|jgi:hypothetical protein
MINCVKCDAQNKDGAKFCKACGNKIDAAAPPIDACLSCGAVKVPGAKFCKSCGAPAAVAKSPAHAPMAADVPEPEPESESGTQAQTGSETLLVTTVNTEASTFSPPLAHDIAKVHAESVLAENAIEEAPTVPAPDLLPTQEASPIEIDNASAHAGLENPAVAPTPDTGQASPVRTRQNKTLLLAAAMIVTIAIGGGLFWWLASKPVAPKPPSDNSIITPTPAPAPAVTAINVEPILPSPAIPALPSNQPQQTALPATTPIEEAITPAMQTKSAPAIADTPQPDKTAKVIVHADPMAGKISALIAKAENHIANGQYDKAIATAESVLEIEPANKSAKKVIAKAKARQMDALKSGSSLE